VASCGPGGEVWIDPSLEAERLEAEHDEREREYGLMMRANRGPC
jgi:hypothetical protein